MTTRHLHDPLAVSVEEAARMIGISRRHLYELIHRRELRTVMIGARRVVPIAELRALLGDREAGEDAA